MAFGIVAWVGVALIAVEWRRARLAEYEPPAVRPRLLAPRAPTVVGGVVALVGLSVMAARPAVGMTVRAGEPNAESVDPLVQEVSAALPAECVREEVAIEGPPTRIADLWQIAVAFDKVGVPVTVAPELETYIRPGASWTGREPVRVTLGAEGWPAASPPGQGVVVQPCGAPE